MVVIYCDGSYHNDYNIMGVGIVSDSFEKYIELPNFGTKTHEIEAVIHSIESGLSQGLSEFVVVNDETTLVNCTNEMLSKNEIVYPKLYNLNRFSYLFNLLKNNNIKLRTPKNKKDLNYIDKSHNLSRSYLKKPKYSIHRKCNKIQVNYKVPNKLTKGDITRNNLTDIQINTMKMYYLSLSNYDDKYSINEVLKWIENQPSSNDKNGRKYSVAQFVNKFCK